MRSVFLFTFAGLCLLMALAIAWVLGITLFYPANFLAGFIVDRANLVKAHIDYLMMAQFLMIFFLAFRHFSLEPPVWVVAALCYGAFFNPAGFLFGAFSAKPPVMAGIAPEPHFLVAAAVSFTLTTAGFAAATALIVRAAWRKVQNETRAFGQAGK